METVYVIGHKNPDTDSICSAMAYAKLKSTIDKTKTYIPARCGNINRQTAFVLKNLNVEAPKLVNDIYPKVKDIMTKEIVALAKGAPLFRVMETIKDKNIRLIPVADENDEFKGIVSVFEISDFLISDRINKKPKYLFDIENFEDVLDGYFYLKQGQRYFEAQIIIGAMPFNKFKSYIERFDYSKVVLIVGKRSKILNYAVKNGVKCIVLTGIDDKNELNDLDFSGYEGCVFISPFDTSQTARRLSLSIPISYIMNKNPLTVKENDYLSRAKELMANSNYRGLPVVDEDKHLRGIVTRSDIIKKHTKKVILVDHNEFSQAVNGIETAQIVEIIDHHRLGTIKTDYPIFFFSKPIGSTCTLVTQLYKHYGIKPDRTTALLLLSGLLSDTVILKSPTTTEIDRQTADYLSEIAGVFVEKYGSDMFKSASSIDSLSANEIVTSDLKIYSEYGIKFGISQIETVNLNAVKERKREIVEELAAQKAKKGLHWIMLLVTDIISSNSILITSGFECETMLSYKKTDENEYYLPGILSRKKQLLPTILSLLEECSAMHKKA